MNRFGTGLRAWRARRGLSQLDLALIAQTTPRHLSFLETGRSRPGEDIVLRLANALDLPLRETNQLLEAAGLEAAYPEWTLDDAPMAPVRQLLKRVLDQHDPFPAFAFAPGLRLIDGNLAARTLYPGMLDLGPEALIDAWCASDPDPEANRLAAHHVVRMLRNEVFHHPHPAIPALLARAEQHATGLAPHTPPPGLPLTQQVLGRTVQTLSTVLRFDRAHDVTMAEIRVELVFPADEASERVFHELAEASALT